MQNPTQGEQKENSRKLALINTDRTVHNGLVFGHGIITLTAFAITIAIAVYAFGAGCSPGDCMSMIHITSTFLSTAQISAGAGWAVSTERSQIGNDIIQYPKDKDTYAFSHYYECMNTAQMADKTCPQPKGVADYIVCLKNDTSTNAALTACNAIATTFPSHWPTPDEYVRCLFGYPAMLNTQNSRSSQNVFRACVQKTMWPFFEIQQGVDSPIFLGSFNWLIMLAVGMICMTSFAVYTVSFYEMGHIKNGEPQFCMRLGALWSGLSATWLVVFLGFLLASAFRNNTAFENDGGVPTTVSTSIVSVAMVSVCLFYFMTELFESGYWDYYWTRTNTFDKETAPHFEHARKIVRRTYHTKTNSRLGKMPQHQESVYKIASEEDVVKNYTPPLIAAWADGYIADACIFVGLAGATGQLTTAMSWQIFLLVLFYRLLNMMIARFMYECFMNNVSESTEVNAHKFFTKPENTVFPQHGTQEEREALIGSQKNPPAKLSLKVMALSTQIAAIYVACALGYVVLNNSVGLMDFTPFYVFFICGFIIPEALRIGVHLYCQMSPSRTGGVAWEILNPHMAIWCIDLIVRIIIITIVVFDVKDSPGTRKFLIDNSNYLVRDYLSILYVPPLYS